MRLSIYTFVKNGLFQDYHVVDMLRHHLPLADEIIVNEGHSTDGTYEHISRIDPKIKIFRSHWGQASSFDWFLKFKITPARPVPAIGACCSTATSSSPSGSSTDCVPTWDTRRRSWCPCASSTSTPITRFSTATPRR